MIPVLKQTYRPNSTAAAFPLGGIGTGNISLGIRGNLCDWEIFNHPGKGVVNPNSFFSLWVREGSNQPISKILEGPIQPPYIHSHGFQPYSVAGLPHFRNAKFYGEYPLVRIDFNDPDIPLEISLIAYTPLIPLQAEDSGIPCAIFNYSLKNLSTEPVSISLAGSCMNPIGEIKIDSFEHIVSEGIGQTRNIFRKDQDLQGIFFTSELYHPTELAFGNLCLATTHPSVSYKTAWLRAGWFDDLREFWNDFQSDGLLQDLQDDAPSPSGKNDTASLAILDTLQPGQTGNYQFILSWYFPNRPKSWKQCCSDKLIRNHYATKFKDSWDVARYVINHQTYLEDSTYQFHNAIYRSTLPIPVKDALSANIVPVRSPTCFWHEDGNFYGYEGCGDDQGCCAGTCTHVWSYAQTVAYLFPNLERNMRLNEFATETETDGYMYFRAYQRFGEQFIWDWGDQKPEAAIDGQMGSILRVLREWKLSGDAQWLSKVSDGVLRSIQFAQKHWDLDGDGLPDGRQHTTYDIEFYGPNPLGTIYFLAGLRAVEELARVMGSIDLAEKYQHYFRSGSEKADNLLWNGEYFDQKIEDVNAHSYQFGAGCLSDQLLGQLHARMLGLGYLLPRDHVRSAIEAIFRYNFKKDFFSHANCQRTYVLNDESGLILCSWPHDGEPDQPFVYSDEVWTGIEYEIASLLIYEGMVNEGLELVKAVRARHDGIRRNPWNEVECGNHYARSMSSWGLLLALSGYLYDAHSRYISFNPAINQNKFRCLFTTGSCWGIYSQDFDDKNMKTTLEVIHGELAIRNIRIYSSRSYSRISSRIGSLSIPTKCDFQSDVSLAQFEPDLRLEKGKCLVIGLS